MAPLYEHSSARIDEIDDRTLFVRVGGDVRDEDLDPFFELLADLLSARGPARILVDASYLGETEPRLCWRILRRARSLGRRIERTAIFGLPPRLDALLWVGTALLRRRDVRSFLWRHEAQSWVRGPA